MKVVLEVFELSELSATAKQKVIDMIDMDVYNCYVESVQADRAREESEETGKHVYNGDIDVTDLYEDDEILDYLEHNRPGSMYTHEGFEITESITKLFKEVWQV